MKRDGREGKRTGREKGGGVVPQLQLLDPPVSNENKDLWRTRIVDRTTAM